MRGLKMKKMVRRRMVLVMMMMKMLRMQNQLTRKDKQEKNRVKKG